MYENQQEPGTWGGAAGVDSTDKLPSIEQSLAEAMKAATWAHELLDEIEARVDGSKPDPGRGPATANGASMGLIYDARHARQRIDSVAQRLATLKVLILA